LSKYLEFGLIEKKPKTKVIGVWSKNHPVMLGIIKWFGRWRQYAFFPDNGTVYNVECLNDIIIHIKELKNEM
jgi:hypothetical protein